MTLPNWHVLLCGAACVHQLVPVHMIRQTPTRRASAQGQFGPPIIKETDLELTVCRQTPPIARRQKNCDDMDVIKPLRNQPPVPVVVAVVYSSSRQGVYHFVVSRGSSDGTGTNSGCTITLVANESGRVYTILRCGQTIRHPMAYSKGILRGLSLALLADWQTPPIELDRRIVGHHFAVAAAFCPI